jgi:hypothetical protein
MSNISNPPDMDATDATDATDQPQQPAAQPQAQPPAQSSQSLDDTRAILSGQSGNASGNPSPENAGVEAANAAAVRPRTGLFARILYSAMTGLKGAGEGLAMGGIPGAVEGAVSPKTVNTQWQQRQQLAASNVDFYKARAAYETTEALSAHNVMERQTEEWKQAQSDRAVNKMMEFQNLGLSPSEFPDDHSADASRVAQDFISQGKIPYVLHAPSADGQHGQLIVYDLSPLLKTPTLSTAVKQGLALVNDPTTDADYARMNPQQRLAIVQKGLTGIDYTPGGSPGEILNQINQLTSLKRVYATAHTNDPDLKSTLAKYDSSIQSLQQARKNLLAGAKEEGKNTAQIKGQEAYSETYNRTKAEQDALNAGQIPGQPSARQALIDDIGQGRVQLTPGMLRSKDGQALLQQVVGKYNDYDPTRADAYKKTREDFTSGKTAVGINSYNTAIAHLGTMFDHIQSATSMDINNPFSAAHRQLDLDKQLVSTELAKAVSNGNMTEGEKKDILEAISGYTVDSYRTRIKEAVTLLHGKLESYQQQWANGMPKAAVATVPIVSPQSDATMAKINGNGHGGQQPIYASAPGKPRIVSYDGGKTWQPAQ